jgi:NAD(P)-dependent dehydrogenase (short-subunit alcohol dehydrogenase family)
MRKRSVLITGGTGGLGRAMVAKFCRSGDDVYIIDLDDGAGHELCAEVTDRNDSGGVARFFKCDLSNLEATKDTVERLVVEASGIEVLVNNAAIYPSKGLLDYSREEYQSVQTINVEASVVCSSAVIPGMIENKWGRIINVSSITAYGKFAKIMPYVVSKASLIGLTRALATELGEHGITVNGICPGAIPTDAEKIHPDPDGYNRFVLEQQALKRRGDVTDIANVVQFFASEESGFVTGQMLNVDGGWVMH